VSATAKQANPPSARRGDAQSVEVLVIGGRCAGAPLATHLARAGVSVLLADRASFPSDTLSTHVFQGGAIASLDRLGVLDEVLATSAPPVARGRVLFANGDDRLEAEVPMPEPGPGLAETIAGGVADGTVERRLADWWRWRNDDAAPRHTWAHSFGSTGPPPHVVIQAQRDILSGPDAAERFW
jgi:glycine/D-amino acid oxidase-like deaminating enzyme